MDASGRKGRISESEMLDSNEGMLDVWGRRRASRIGRREPQKEREEKERAHGFAGKKGTRIKGH